MKPFTKIASALFGMGALLHLFRLFYPFRVEIAGNKIPAMASVLFVLVGAGLCIGLWRESKQ
jgi:hypothetical protein